VPYAAIYSGNHSGGTFRKNFKARTGIIEAYRVLEIFNEIYDTSLIKYNYAPFIT